MLNTEPKPPLLQIVASKRFSWVYLYGMELMVKVYTDGRARLGILYTYEFTAVKEYETLIKNNRNQQLSLRMEMQKSKLTLVFTSSHSGAKTVYKDIEFRPEQVIRLQNAFQSGTVFEFVHVFSRANSKLIAKPFHKAEFLTVNGFELIGA
jgi:hypothetical protein